MVIRVMNAVKPSKQSFFNYCILFLLLPLPLSETIYLLLFTINAASPTPRQAPGKPEYYLSCSLLYAHHLEQCLTNLRHSICIGLNIKRMILLKGQGGNGGKKLQGKY